MSGAEERDAKRLRLTSKNNKIDMLSRTLFVQKSAQHQLPNGPAVRSFSAEQDMNMQNRGLASTSGHSCVEPGAQSCQLLELPAELRELIWIHAVTDWQLATPNTPTQRAATLIRRPIRLDRLNSPELRPPEVD